MHITDKKNFYLSLTILVFSLSGLPALWKLIIIVVSTCALMVFSIKWKLPTGLPKRFLSKSVAQVENIANTTQQEVKKSIAPVIHDVVTAPKPKHISKPKPEAKPEIKAKVTGESKKEPELKVVEETLTVLPLESASKNSNHRKSKAVKKKSAKLRKRATKIKTIHQNTSINENQTT